MIRKRNLTVVELQKRLKIFCLLCLGDLLLSILLLLAFHFHLAGFGNYSAQAPFVSLQFLFLTVSAAVLGTSAHQQTEKSESRFFLYQHPISRFRLLASRFWVGLMLLLICLLFSISLTGILPMVSLLNEFQRGISGAVVVFGLLLLSYSWGIVLGCLVFSDLLASALALEMRDLIGSFGPLLGEPLFKFRTSSEREGEWEFGASELPEEAKGTSGVLEVTIPLHSPKEFWVIRGTGRNVFVGYEF